MTDSPAATALILQFGSLENALDHWLNSDWYPTELEMVVLNVYANIKYDTAQNKMAKHALKESDGYRYIAMHLTL